MASYYFGKNSVYTHELSQKSDFQSSTIKPDNGGPTVETRQVWPLEWFQIWFSFLKNFKFKLKKFISNSFKNIEIWN